MRDFLKSSRRRFGAGWFCSLVLLALPNCALDAGPYDGAPTGLEGGEGPRTSAVMCEIAKVPDPASDGCASAQDLLDGMPRNHAAIALVQGEQNTLVLDFSLAATSSCPDNAPRKTQIYGEFPDGYPVCLNCKTQMPFPYPDGNAVCVAQCVDLVLQANQPQPADVEEFCKANARVSPNFEKDKCYDGACTSGGWADPDFPDPRKKGQEPVKWMTQNGTTGGDNGNNLQRTAGRSGNFDAGAFSDQLITHGDGWVEFSVNDNTKAYAVGLSFGAFDGDETVFDLNFALVLKADGLVYVYENGAQVGGDRGSYAAHERFRIHFVDNNDSTDPATETATISYARVVGQCDAGMQCTETPIASQNAPIQTQFPLRVDASLVDDVPTGAILENVTLVRIQ